MTAPSPPPSWDEMKQGTVASVYIHELDRLARAVVSGLKIDSRYMLRCYIGSERTLINAGRELSLDDLQTDATAIAKATAPHIASEGGGDGGLMLFV